MRISVPAILLACAVPVAVAVNQNATYVAQQIAQISPCGLTCLSHTIPEVGCTIVDTNCQCASSRLVSITAKCMYANCTFPETLALSRTQANICDRPYESQNYMIRVMTIVCAIITVASVMIRLVTKSLLSLRFGLDDIFIVLALISECFFTALGVKLEQYGFGDHVWTISDSSIPPLFILFYSCEVIYVLTIGFVKISLLFFYLRVFRARIFRTLCWLTLTSCILSSLAFILITLFQCKPIRYVWDKTTTQGKCINYNAVAWANAAINIVQDLVIVALPIRETVSLQLSLKQKVGLVAMFCVGGFVCVTSMIRLESLRTFGLTADPTWDNIPVTFWSTVETTAAIFCACMPAVRAGLVHLFPSLSSIPRPPTHSNSFLGSQVVETTSSASRNRRERLASIIPMRSRSSHDEGSSSSTFEKPPLITVTTDLVQTSVKSGGGSLDIDKPLPVTPEYAKSYL